MAVVANFAITGIDLNSSLSALLKGSRFQVQGSRLGFGEPGTLNGQVQGFRFKVSGSRFKVQGFRFEVGVRGTLNLEL